MAKAQTELNNVLLPRREQDGLRPSGAANQGTNRGHLQELWLRSGHFYPFFTVFLKHHSYEFQEFYASKQKTAELASAPPPSARACTHTDPIPPAVNEAMDLVHKVILSWLGRILEGTPLH